ncbi:MAG: DMT family transporter [Anaerolineales bacterium]|jgi:drug/metabolite transporter (DMT)-like permease
MGNNKLVPYFEVLFAVVAWGASFIATKIGVKDVTPITVVWLRFGMGVVILGIAVIARKEFAWPARNEWAYFALLGLLGITWHQWLQSTGLVTAQASTTAWIVATTPIFMALLGWLVLKEKLTVVQTAGIGLAAVGVLVVVSNGDLTSIFSGKFGTPGDYLIMLSAPNWAVFSTLSRRGLQKHPAARMMLYVMTFGWLFSSIGFFAGGHFSQIPKLSAGGWIGVSFLGIFCSGLAYIAWYDGLQAIAASQVGAFLYLEPLVAVVVAGVILSEPITWVSLTGGGVILLGVYLVNRPQKADLRRD